MVSSNALIEVDHVFKTYPVADRGERLVLDDLNFRLVPGEIVAVLGSNGAGKSTMNRTISGVVRAWRGAIRFGKSDDEPQHQHRGQHVPDARQQAACFNRDGREYPHIRLA